jgi:hypothetical protein
MTEISAPYHEITNGTAKCQFCKRTIPPKTLKVMWDESGWQGARTSKSCCLTCYPKLYEKTIMQLKFIEGIIEGVKAALTPEAVAEAETRIREYAAVKKL